MVGTIYKNIFSKEPYYAEVNKMLERIKNGNSKQLVSEIRLQVDKERANKMKCNLPSVCFSGKFGKDRTDVSILEHSGFIVLDFDNLENCESDKEKFKTDEYVYACWISPSGNGLKALIKIADGNKHKEHFEALQEKYKAIDRSGINVSRVCYESWDAEIYINENSKVWNKTKKTEKVVEKVNNNNTNDTFKKIFVWLTNKGDAFVKGERNIFVFKLASACCRFGIDALDCENLCEISLITIGNEFSKGELMRTIKSAYKTNASFFGSAEFTNDVLVDRISRAEIQTKETDLDIYNPDVKPKDVIFGEDAKQGAINIYENGYEDVESMGIPELDEHFKLKRGEITLLTGHGNYGKSTFLKYILLVKILTTGKKFAFFSPEENPAHEFYHDFVEIYLGQNCTPTNSNRPSRAQYEDAYDMISKHIFYVYPKEVAPTPDYIKERFLELIIKEKVDGCIIDPFNQMSNDYKGAGGRSDKYLETFLSDCTRFAQINSIYFLIVAHPKGGWKKDDTGNYPCPDVYDIAEGGMWNNKMDNIIIYHRAKKQTDPNDCTAEFHTKKIRRQKTVGKLGTLNIELSRITRRYFFNGTDYLARIIAGVTTKVESIQPNVNFYEVEKINFEDEICPF